MKSIKLKYRNFPGKFILCFLIALVATFIIFDFTAPKIPLMGFHAIINNSVNDRPFLTTKYSQMNYFSEDFEIFLDYLVRRNFWFLSAQELDEYFITKSKSIPSKHSGQKPIMLSFDDGYKNNYSNLLPLLEKMEQKYNKKVKVVLFVNSGTLADYESNASIHMTCKDLRNGLEKGYYDIQSHGFTHKRLTEINRETLIDELSKGQTELRKCTEGIKTDNQVASYIAYPFGAYNKNVENYASKYYLSGYLYNGKVMKLGWFKNHYEIPRLTINRKQSPSRLIKIAERSQLIRS